MFLKEKIANFTPVISFGSYAKYTKTPKTVNEEKKIQRRSFKETLFFLGLLSVSSNYINRTAMFFNYLHFFTMKKNQLNQ